jgi:hypothetical protein
MAKREPEGKSLFLFSHTNIFRKKLFKLTTNKIYLLSVHSLGLLSALLLCLYSPLSPVDNNLNYVIVTLETVPQFNPKVFTYFFIAEMCIQTISHGAIFNGPFSYFRQNLNGVEGVFNFIILYNRIVEGKSAGYLNAARILRTFTLISYFFKGASINIIIRSIIKSVPSIFNLIILELVFLFAFAVINVSFFRGTFYSCDKSFIPSTFSSLGAYHDKVVTSTDCLDYGGDWTNSVQNFDHVINGMGLLFQIITTEGWIDIMYKMVDSVGVGLQPIPNNNRLWSYYGIVLIMISNFLMLNFFAGIVMDSFSSEKDKIGGYYLLSEPQKEWVDLQCFVMRQKVEVKIERPKHPLRLALYKFWKTKTWKGINFVLVIISSLTYLLVYHRQSPAFENTLNIIQIVTFGLFVLEVILKCVCYGQNFYKDYSLGLDILLIVLESVTTFYFRSEGITWPKIKARSSE